ncbi:MAG: D-alanyl-D-alanine carboxypeptidase [Lachnospiraceae bacterium]|nr:D-alanyl-D-alanine carboxypeptidase [Lachnospiraceae bacterium]MDD7026352.1 D-alanyl-D-alanine carboxypeptidase [Lachnospiraceae bacterium]MDY5701641.1 D-alanyl-D-alanine carboxypeptidase family protein [Lachnospiraceae bacterium]
MPVQGEEVSLQAPSAILMESKTGTVIYEKNSDEVRSPASITKIMTLLLIFEALEQKQITLEDKVVTSAHAKSMGGSQVFLEEGEEQTVETLIKCIAVASGNDASVAMAEYIAGSEEAFVEKMNQKAAQLGMGNTHFVDCCGLSSSDEHHTTARDVAVMSKELINRYPEVFNYTTIWMEDITHVTRKGESNFTLSSTNKLLKQYPYANGLKTGSTDKAKYCLSATAQKDEVQLIAVVMAAPDHKVRFKDCETLLNYGFAKAHFYEDKQEAAFVPLPVEGGVKDKLSVSCQQPFTYLDLEGNDLSKITKEERLPERVKAPVKKGDKVGEVVYFLQEKKIGSVAIVAEEEVEEAKLGDTFRRAFGKWLLGTVKI